MSAGATSAYPGEPPLVVHRELGLLAPGMRVAVAATVAECHARGLDAVVYETYRSRETAIVYWRRGRTQIPPHHVVTHAPNELYSWHGYGLACDIISKKKGWTPGDFWFGLMGEIAKRHGLKWGGDWVSPRGYPTPDLPHVQWGRCRASPSDRARELIRTGGLNAVWREVGAAA